MRYAIRRDSEHRYWVRDTLGPTLQEFSAPGFSEIIADLGIKDDGHAFFTEDGRNQGNALHGWLLFLAQGQTPDSEPEPGIRGRVEGIKQFLADSGFKLTAGEVPQYDPLSHYACTPDIYGTMGGAFVVIDCKRANRAGWHPLQTAAQKIALKAGGFDAEKRYSLYLKDFGYSLIEHTDKADENRWRAVVAAYHVKSFYARR